MLRTAVRLKSWRRRPATPAPSHAEAHAFRKSLRRWPRRWRPGEEREEVRDDLPGASLEGFYALELVRQQRLDLRREVHEAPLVVLRRTRVQAQRPGRKVELAPFEREDLALRAPAVGVGDRRGRLEIRRQVAAHRLVLLALEEAGPRRRLLELSDHRQAEELPVLVRQSEHPDQDRELAVD